jgi:hypothetical protein
MILASTVYETVLDLARKDLRGRSLSPEEFNRIAPIVNEKVFSSYYKEFEESSENSEALSAFKVLNESIAVGAGGIVTLPARYYHIVGRPRYVDADGITRHLDLVSSLEDADREDDYLTKATLTYPTFRFGIATTTADMTIHVRPTAGIATILMDYIRTTDVPILDYYLNDTTAEYSFMAYGATVAVPLGSTAMNGTQGLANVVSTTINWEWNNEDLPLIAALFLQELGAQLPNAEIYEAGTISETKIENL